MVTGMLIIPQISNSVHKCAPTLTNLDAIHILCHSAETPGLGSGNTWGIYDYFKQQILANTKRPSGWCITYPKLIMENITEAGEIQLKGGILWLKCQTVGPTLITFYLNWQLVHSNGARTTRTYSFCTFQPNTDLLLVTIMSMCLLLFKVIVLVFTNEF